MAENVRDILADFMNGMKAIGAEYGESVQAFNAFYMANVKPGALDTKTKELIQLGIGVAIRCKYCIVAHTYNAYKAGATKGEILETGLSAVNMGGGPVMTYAVTLLRAAADEFEHDFDRK